MDFIVGRVYNYPMTLVNIILAISIIAAVIFYFYKRSKWMNEQEREERFRDLYE